MKDNYDFKDGIKNPFAEKLKNGYRVKIYRKKDETVSQTVNQSSSNVSDGGTSAVKLTCTHCGKQVAGGTYIQGVFYCPMCASIINKNNQQSVQKEVPPFFSDWMKQAINIPDCCVGCASHPSNGGSGICHCTLPYFSGQGPRVQIVTSTGKPEFRTGSQGINLDNLVGRIFEIYTDEYEGNIKW